MLQHLSQLVAAGWAHPGWALPWHCPGNLCTPTVSFGDTSGAIEVCSLGLATLEVVPLCAIYRHKSKFLKTLIEITANILKKNLL